MTGHVGRLRGELQHFAYRDVAEHMETIERLLDARRAPDARSRAAAPRRLGIAWHPRLAFFRNYILKGGFRDGTPGLIISRMNAYYVFLKFAKLWELDP